MSPGDRNTLAAAPIVIATNDGGSERHTSRSRYQKIAGFSDSPQLATLEKRSLRWSDGREHFDSDPKAPVSRRFQAWITRVLHLDAQL
jgi:hypothetical protein